MKRIGNLLLDLVLLVFVGPAVFVIINGKLQNAPSVSWEELIILTLWAPLPLALLIAALWYMATARGEHRFQKRWQVLLLRTIKGATVAIAPIIFNPFVALLFVPSALAAGAAYAGLRTFTAPRPDVL